MILNFKDMSDDEELYIARPHSFFGVYILYNINPKFKGSIYIGFTVNPERRIRQHNREIKGGAWKTGRNRGPWHMVLITHGFNTKLAALQFEWAWQNPKKSRRLNHLPGKQTKENVFTYRLRVLSEMLNTGPWNRLSLTIQWLKQEYFEHFPVSRPPPTHMPIAYGAIRTVNKRKSDGVQSRRQLFNAEDEVKICKICSEPDYKIDENPMLHCIVDICQFVSHMTCLATTFLQQMKHDGKYLIPVSGTCPSCREEVLWSDVIKQKKYSLTPGAECTVDFRDSQEEDIHDTQEEGSSEDFDDDDDFD